MPELLEVSEEQARAAYEKGCEECIKIGGQWVHLRMCLVCGKIGAAIRRP